MVWPRLTGRKGSVGPVVGYHQEDVKHASAGREKKRPKKTWLIRSMLASLHIRGDMNECKMTMCVAHQDKGTRFVNNSTSTIR